MHQLLVDSYSQMIGATTSQLMPHNKSYSFAELSIDSIRDFISKTLMNPTSPSDLSASIFSSEFIKDFVIWAYKNRYPLGWRIAIFFAKFVDENNYEKNNSLVRNALISTCSQWTYADKSQHQSIVMYCDLLPNEFIMSIKSKNARLPREIYIIDKELALPCSIGYYTSLFEFESVDFILKHNLKKLC